MASDFGEDYKKLVWTNGCFDLFHAGHADYLKQASELGHLVVGITSDDKLRSEKREPINSEKQRAEVVASIKGVNEVMIYNDCAGLLSVIQPHIYVKGGDYTLETMNQTERRLMEYYGAEIKFIPIVHNISSSELIRRIVIAEANNRSRN